MQRLVVLLVQGEIVFDVFRLVRGAMPAFTYHDWTSKPIPMKFRKNAKSLQATTNYTITPYRRTFHVEERLAKGCLATCNAIVRYDAP
jgi:hypothetical protein